MKELAAGMENLAQRNLAYSIDPPFKGDLEKLRGDFNKSVARIRDTLFEIQKSSVDIQNSGQQMAGAAEDLAKRQSRRSACA